MPLTTPHGGGRHRGMAADLLVAGLQSAKTLASSRLIWRAVAFAIDDNFHGRQALDSPNGIAMPE